MARKQGILISSMTMRRILIIAATPAALPPHSTTNIAQLLHRTNENHP